VVSANAGGTPFQGRTVVNLVAQSPPSRSALPTHSAAPAAVVQPHPSATSRGPLGREWLLWVALLAVFLGLVGAVIAFISPSYVSRSQRRVESIEGYLAATRRREDERSSVSRVSASLVSMGDKVMDSRSSTPQTQRLLERADLPLRAGEWAVLRAVTVVVGVAGGMFLLRGSPNSTFVGAGLGALVGTVLPVLFLKFAASHRAKKFETQLPDILTLVSSSLSTGFSLLQALDAVAQDADDPCAKEFSRALAETRIGAEVTESLDHLADRMDSKNMRWTAMAIDIQRQVGGNLAETLRNTATTLRDRQALSRHVRALSAEGRLSAYILLALPVGLFAYMYLVNRPYVALLWTTMIGMGMLGAGVISLGVGVFWMNKVVKVEV
jgi:tight adherence protein B